MHFTLKQLRYVDAALRTGSIVQAAREMNISQSSIAAAIDASEALMGVPLFHRMPAKGIVPTDEGLLAASKIAAFLADARILESDLLSSRGATVGSLRMGCYAPTAPYMLPRILNRLTAQHPEIRIELREGDMESLVGFLNTGVIDAALTYRRTIPETMFFQPMFRARPYVLLPEVSQLAAKSELSLTEIADLPMIMLDLAATKPYFTSIFKQAGLAPRIVHTTQSSSVLRGLVAANYGYSILNICGPNDRKGENGYVCRPLIGEIDEPAFGLAYTRNARHTPIVNAVLEICSLLSSEGAFDDLFLAPAP